VADQQDWTRRRIDHAFGEGDIVRERDRGILNDGYVVASLLQDVVYRLPARAVNEAAVNQNDRKSQCIHDVSFRSM
jgi:hypothetical protein